MISRKVPIKRIHLNSLNSRSEIWRRSLSGVDKLDQYPLRKKCPYSELFWSGPFFP